MANEQQAREAAETNLTAMIPLSQQREFRGYGTQLAGDTYCVAIYIDREPDLCSDKFFDALPTELKTRTGTIVPVMLVNVGDLQPH